MEEEVGEIWTKEGPINQIFGLWPMHTNVLEHGQLRTFCPTMATSVLCTGIELASPTRLLSASNFSILTQGHAY